MDGSMIRRLWEDIYRHHRTAGFLNGLRVHKAMAKTSLSQYRSLLIVAVLVIALYLLFASSGTLTGSYLTNEGGSSGSTSSCTSGSTRDCTTSSGAPGNQNCTSGAWGTCGAKPTSGGTTVTNPPSATTYTATFNAYDLPPDLYGKWSVTIVDRTGSSKVYTSAGTTKISIPNLKGGESYTVKSPVAKTTNLRYVCKDSSTGGTTIPAAAPCSGAITSTKTFRIDYHPQYTVVITVNNNVGGFGIITAPPEINKLGGSGWFDFNSQVTIQTSGAGGHKFGFWYGTGEGSYTGTNNPATINVVSPISQRAYYDTAYNPRCPIGFTLFGFWCW